MGLGATWMQAPHPHPSPPEFSSAERFPAAASETPEPGSETAQERDYWGPAQTPQQWSQSQGSHHHLEQLLWYQQSHLGSPWEPFSQECSVAAMQPLQGHGCSRALSFTNGYL